MRIHANIFENLPCKIDGYDGVIITNLVMTFLKLSAANKQTINTYTKGFDNEKRIHSAGTHDPNYPNIGWILKTGNTCRIGCRIATPVTEETKYSWFKKVPDSHLLTVVF